MNAVSQLDGGKGCGVPRNSSVDRNRIFSTESDLLGFGDRFGRSRKDLALILKLELARWRIW